MELETQNITITPTGVTRQGSSNERGHFNFTETTSKTGAYHAESELKAQDFYSTDKETAIKGNKIQDTNGSSSNIVTGVDERLSGSRYDVTGSNEQYQMGYNEQANRAQAKLAATRCGPDKVPDTSAVGAISELMKPAPNLLNTIVQPKAEELKEEADAENPSPGILTTVTTEITNYLKKLTTVIKKCSVSTAKEMAKIQGNYIKDSAKKSLEEKQKMYKKMPVPSREAFMQNMGAILFPDGGDITSESAMNALTTITDPIKLIGLFFSPSTESLPKVQHFDKKQHQKIAAEVLPDVTEAERRNT